MKNCSFLSQPVIPHYIVHAAILLWYIFLRIFHQDGRLCCGSANLCVQVRDNLSLCPGRPIILPYINSSYQYIYISDSSTYLFIPIYDYLVLGAEVLLGPGPTSETVPPYMSVFGRKMLPGSGMLAVKVHTDGPTRVLEISDIKHRVKFYLVI